MITIENHLEAAARDAHTSIDQLPSRDVSSVAHRDATSRIIAGSATVTLAAAVLVVAATVMTRPSDTTAATPGGDDVPASTSTVAPADDPVVSTTIGFDDGSDATIPLVVPSGFPYLTISLPGWYPAYTHPTDTVDESFGVEFAFERMSEDGSGGFISITVQNQGIPYIHLDDLAPLATDTQQLEVRGQDATAYHIPREAIQEDSDSDAYVVSWVEDGDRAGYALAFGLDLAELADALGSLNTISEQAWFEQYLVSETPATTTTVITPAG